MIYNFTFQWRATVWTWCGEVVLPGGKRHKLPVGIVSDVAKGMIAPEIPWIVSAAIDALDAETLR